MAFLPQPIRDLLVADEAKLHQLGYDQHHHSLTPQKATMNQPLVLLAFAIWTTAFPWQSISSQEVAALPNSDWEGVHLANYVDAADLPQLKKLGINTVLMEFDRTPKDWQDKYEAIVDNGLRVVPVLWGKHQSVWKWNRSNQEWETDASKYPRSTGAIFLDFLQRNDAFKQHTFAIYSFHEPWYVPDNGKRKGTVDPLRQQKFWKQIRQQFDGELKIYGEEVSWVPECKNGCVDYDYITLYSFAHNEAGDVIYRPGGRFKVGETGIDGSQAPPVDDREQAKKIEREQITLMHQTIQDAAAATDGTRTKLIALMGTFAHDQKPDVWNRMPTTQEMLGWGRDIVRPERHRLAGLGWYSFRNPTDYYKQFLENSRFDPAGKDRWRTIAEVGKTILE